ncbi:hypothetical protein [Streptomyces sp. NPDC087300]|uniref:hypothetical protein n=1 Tax=Streptomyces sp. NPDC087300 TaxID=3365780 RepID=UPI00382A4C95
MPDPVSISREFTTDDDGNLRVRAPVREWPYPVPFADNGLKWDEKGLWVYEAPAMHPIRQRWDAPRQDTIPAGESKAYPLALTWTNPGERQAVVSLLWALRIHATSQAADANASWDVAFRDPERPLMEGASHTLAVNEGPVEGAWVPLALPAQTVEAGAVFSSAPVFTVTNHAVSALTVIGWTVRAAGIAIEGGA